MSGAHLRHLILASGAAVVSVVLLSCGAFKPVCVAARECVVSCDSTEIIESDCDKPCPDGMVDRFTCPAASPEDGGHDAGNTDAGDDGGDAGDGEADAGDAGLTCAQLLGADYEEFETRCDGIDNDCSGAVDIFGPRALLVGPGTASVFTHEFQLVESRKGDLFGAWGAAGDGRSLDAGAAGTFIHRFDHSLRLKVSTRLPVSPHAPMSGMPRLTPRPDGGYSLIEEVNGEYAVWELDGDGDLQRFVDAGYRAQSNSWRSYTSYLVAPDGTVVAGGLSINGTYILDLLFTDGGSRSETLDIARGHATVAFAVDESEFALIAATDGGRMVPVGDAGDPWPGVFAIQNSSQLDLAGDRTALIAIELRPSGERVRFVQFPGERRIYAPLSDAGEPLVSVNHLTQLRDGGLYFTYALEQQSSLNSRIIYGVRLCR